VNNTSITELDSLVKECQQMFYYGFPESVQKTQKQKKCECITDSLFSHTPLRQTKAVYTPQVQERIVIAKTVEQNGHTGKDFNSQQLTVQVQNFQNSHT